MQNHLIQLCWRLDAVSSSPRRRRVMELLVKRHLLEAWTGLLDSRTRCGEDVSEGGPSQ